MLVTSFRESCENQYLGCNSHISEYRVPVFHLADNRAVEEALTVSLA